MKDTVQYVETTKPATYEPSAVEPERSVEPFPLDDLPTEDETPRKPRSNKAAPSVFNKLDDLSEPEDVQDGAHDNAHENGSPPSVSENGAEYGRPEPTQPFRYPA